MAAVVIMGYDFKAKKKRVEAATVQTVARGLCLDFPPEALLEFYESQCVPPYVAPEDDSA